MSFNGDGGDTIASCDMHYQESDKIIDHTIHNNYIETIEYFAEIDKMVLYEQ